MSQTISLTEGLLEDVTVPIQATHVRITATSRHNNGDANYVAASNISIFGYEMEADKTALVDAITSAQAKLDEPDVDKYSEE